jgi:hypothetical protein
MSGNSIIGVGEIYFYNGAVFNGTIPGGPGSTGPIGPTGPANGPTGPIGPTGPANGPTGPTGPYITNLLSEPNTWSGTNTFNIYNLSASSSDTSVYFNQTQNPNTNTPIQGLSLYFNELGNGEIDLIEGGGIGQGGFAFYAGNDSVVPKLLLTMLQNGSSAPTITTTGSISASTFNITSDYRIKENITELNDTYSIDNLRAVEYDNLLINKKSLGFIAHEVQEQYPFLVNGEKDGKENQSIHYQELIPILVKEIQDLKKRITILEN